MNASPGRAGRLAYLSLEALRPGRAAHTHVNEIIAGLEEQGWVVSRFVARAAEGPRSRSALSGLPEHARVLRRLLPRLRGHDVLYVRSHPLAWPAAIAARRAGLIVVHEINGVLEDLGVTYPWLRSLRRTLVALQVAQHRGADALFAVTPGLVAWAGSVAPEVPVHLVPNGANLRLFTPDGPRETRSRPYALFVGGLAKWHGIDTMLGALRDPSWPTDVDLVIAGEGGEDAVLAAATGALDRLVWLRRQEYAAVPALLRGAVAALIPIGNPDGRSRYGVLPLKLFEAMACGVPVLVSDLPGQADLVREANAGVVVPLGDSAALGQAVAALWADPMRARALGEAGAAVARRAHGWTHRARRVHDVLIDMRARMATT